MNTRASSDSFGSASRDETELSGELLHALLRALTQLGQLHARLQRRVHVLELPLERSHERVERGGARSADAIPPGQGGERQVLRRELHLALLTQAAARRTSRTGGAGP